MHKCSYCFVKSYRFQAQKDKYEGDIRLVKSELDRNLGKEKFWFVCSSNDLFAENVPKTWIDKVLKHCNDNPDNKYLFQTKNPERFHEFEFSDNHFLCITLETNKYYNIGRAPKIINRFNKFASLEHDNKVVTIEPILDFDLETFAAMIKYLKPLWVNIGADSKNNGLEEPGWAKVEALIILLEKFTKVKLKTNLERLKRCIN